MRKFFFHIQLAVDHAIKKKKKKKNIYIYIYIYILFVVQCNFVVKTVGR